MDYFDFCWRKKKLVNYENKYFGDLNFSIERIAILESF
jgi:hypothetical protein